MAKSVGTKGNPLESSKPFCVKERWWRRPLTQKAASWTRCKAMRGQRVCPLLWLQAQSKSQMPKRRCSGAKSQTPTWLPEILSASNWRTARSRLAGSEGSVRSLRRVRWVWICWGRLLGRQAESFFLQPKVADHSLDAANANKMVSLLKLLGNDLSRSVWIQEPMTNDLTDHLFSAPIVGLWPAHFALQSQGALSFKLFQQLKIALFSVTEFTSSLSGAQSLTLAFEKHGQLVGNLIIVGQEDRTGMADEFCGRIEELEHGAKLGIKGTKSQIKYGGI